MAASQKKTYEVALNSGAMGLAQGEDSMREVRATRFSRDPNNNAITFFDGDEEVAFFQYAVGVSVKES